MKKKEVKQEINTKTSVLVFGLTVVILLIIAIIYYTSPGRFYKTVTIYPIPIEDELYDHNNPYEIRITEKPSKEDKALIVDDTSNYNYSFNVYYEKNEENDENEFCTNPEFSSCNENSYLTIKTKTDESAILDVFKDKYVFYKDNGVLKVYDAVKNESYIINIRTDVFNFVFHVDPETNEFYGLEYMDSLSGKYSYFSILKNEVLYDNEYDNRVN